MSFFKVKSYVLSEASLWKCGITGHISEYTGHLSGNSSSVKNFATIPVKVKEPDARKN